MAVAELAEPHRKVGGRLLAYKPAVGLAVGSTVQCRVDCKGAGGHMLLGLRGKVRLQ